MKTKCFLICSIGLFGISLFGHEQVVHQAITSHAEASAYANSSAYASFISTIASDRPRIGPIGAVHWMVFGSYHEDDADLDSGGKRSYNHFYDPLDTSYGKGLSEIPTFSYRWPIGNNSFVWGSVLNCPGIDFGGAEFGAGKNVNTFNTWSWKYARICEYDGLTASSQSERQQVLDYMFRSVGQVMHLLEDTTSPQHVRNEQHVTLDNLPSPWESPIENWGLKNLISLNYGDGSMLDWRGAGFTKLEDFWDRHKYNGDASKLDADLGNGADTLGLAEWCNGNFLGARHQYAEYYQPGDIRYYPYPSVLGTDYQQVGVHPSSGIDGIVLSDGTSGKAIYLAKTGNGISITHHSRVSYLGAMYPNQLKSCSTTINDPAVLKDYHDILIPRAVKYSAGLLDYFFRGQLSISVSVLGGGNSILHVFNNSAQALSGGTFYLYSEDAAGNRSLFQQNDLPGTLDEFTTFDIYSNANPPNPTKFILVYKGTIGIDGNQNALDPVDDKIAIAVVIFTLYGQVCTDCVGAD